MVPLPLFKLASLFVRHVSKYGAVSILLSDRWLGLQLGLVLIPKHRTESSSKRTIIPGLEPSPPGMARKYTS